MQENKKVFWFLVVIFVLFGLIGGVALTSRAATVAPVSYSAYTGTDVKLPPPAPALGPANSIIRDPVFGSRILRVTDQNTALGKSFISSDSGFTRTFNADSTSIKIMDDKGWSSWLEFDPDTMQAGKQPHNLGAFDARWEWSAVNPDIIYFIKGSELGSYNKTTGTMKTLARAAEPLAYHVAVVGRDAWACAAAGSGIQNTYTKIFCVNLNNPAQTKLINAPTGAGIHSLYGSAGGTHLGVTFHNASWGGNGDAVYNLSTDTWSYVANTDYYWSGHVSLGNGKFVNGSGSKNGRDSRGALVRDPDDLTNSSKYNFIMQPNPTGLWNDGEHSSWWNSSGNPGAPVLFSRYHGAVSPENWQAWMGEIILAATDGSNTVWRFAHTHQGKGSCYYGGAFAQISNDGRWAIFSSPWDGTLGGPGGFGCPSRIDTFIVELQPAATAATIIPTPAQQAPAAPIAMPIEWVNLKDAALREGVLYKTAGCNGCGNSGAVSSQKITSEGYVEFTAAEIPALRGFGLHPGNPGTDIRNFKYSWRLQAGWAEVREFGVYKRDTSFKAGDIFRIEIAAGIVKYLKNDAVIYTSSLPPSYSENAVAGLAGKEATISKAVIRN